MSVNIASALLKKRIKNRKLPGLNIPQTGMEEVDRALLQMREYLQMYEGDTKAPKERFVTLDELENAGLVGTATRQGFSTINKVLGKQVDPVQSSNITRKQIFEITKTGAETLSELSDSEVDGANPNDFFAYDGSNWVNRGLFNADNVWTGINRFSKGYIEFQERQASDPPIAQTGRGYLWLEAGQTLYFRDEAGTDTDLTAGGGGGLTDVVDDLTPQLGGDLDSNGSDIIMLDNDKVFFGTGSDASMYFDGTSMIIDGVNDVSNLLFQNFASHRFYDLGGTDYLYIEHDGTDAYIGGVNTAGLELQFFTALTASLLQTTTLGTHVYDSDQTVGAGQDNYVMTYDDGLGTIQLEAAAGGSGTVTASSSPLDGEIAVWTSGTDIEGDANFSYDGTTLLIQSVGANMLTFKDTNSTVGAASGTMNWVDSADTTMATIGVLAVVDVLTLSSTAGGVLISAGTGNGVQIDSDTRVNLTGGGTFSINDSTDTDDVSFSHDGTDFNIVGTTTTDINVTGITSFNVPALASTGAVTGSNLNIADWDTAFAFTDSLTATAAEINLLDLAGLTVGWVLAADSATTASWQAPAGGSNDTPLDIIGDINMATPPVDAAFTAQLRFMDNDETDVIAEIGYDGSATTELWIRNNVAVSPTIFEGIAAISGATEEILRLQPTWSSGAGRNAHMMAPRGIFNNGIGYSSSDPPLMVTSGGGVEDGSGAAWLGIWPNTISAVTAGSAAGTTLSINPRGGDVWIGNISGAGTTGEVILSYATGWALRTAEGAVNLSWRTSSGGTGGVVQNDCFYNCTTHGQVIEAQFGLRDTDNVGLIANRVWGSPWNIEADNASGTPVVMAVFHPVDGTSINIPDSATQAMRTATQANGLLEINTDAAGTWERVLTLSDLSGGGDVTKVGTPVDDQVGVWTGDGTIEGTSTFTYDGSVLNLNSVGGTVLVLQDNNSTGGAAAAVSMAFHDDAATVLGTIGQLPVVDAFAISSAATMILSTSATSSYIQLSGDVGTRVSSGTYMRFYDSGDTEFMSFANDDTDLLVTATTTAAMRFSGTDLAFNDSDVLRMGTGDDFSMTFNGTNLVLNSNVGSFDIQLNDLDIDMNDNHLIEAVLNNYAVLSQSEVISANAATLTYTEGNAYELTLAAATGNVTVTLSGGPPSGTYGVMEVKILQDGTARTITWAGGTFVWLDDTAHVMNPTVTTGISIYVFETWDGGTTWYASGGDWGP